MSRKVFLAKEQFIERKVNELTATLNKKVNELIAEYLPADGQELSLRDKKEFEDKVARLTKLYAYELNKLIMLGIKMAQLEALHSSHESLKAHLGENFDRVRELILRE
ncbi:MAG TPA: hypothetical protein GX745_08990 [Clostridiales bacterium]|nr:hypothetical protein [Clostridiales bacterium]